MQIKTLADFKRLPKGTKLKLHSTNMENHKNLGKTRKIEHKQTNAIRFEGGSWLEYPKASDFEIDKNLIIIKMYGGDWLAYKVIN